MFEDERLQWVVWFNFMQFEACFRVLKRLREETYFRKRLYNPRALMSIIQPIRLIHSHVCTDHTQLLLTDQHSGLQV